jgi:hypothetical protein
MAITNSTFYKFNNVIYNFYRDYKTIEFKDIIKKPPIAISASKNQDFLN